MKIKYLCLIPLTLILVACSDNQEAAKSSFLKSKNIEQTTRSSTESSESKKTTNQISNNNSSASNIDSETSTITNTSTSSLDDQEYPPYVAEYVSLNGEQEGKPLRDAYGHIFRNGFYIHSSYATTTNGKTEFGMVYQLNQGMRVDQTLILKADEAKEFLDWIRQTAPDGTTKNGLESNYKYWLENVKK
ncbi:hypothetical protein [Streptococcus bovimastitidis]|nr:hypothetical protein [Streptococcus bovimastitidis]